MNIIGSESKLHFQMKEILHLHNLKLFILKNSSLHKSHLLTWVFVHFHPGSLFFVHLCAFSRHCLKFLVVLLVGLFTRTTHRFETTRTTRRRKTEYVADKHPALVVHFPRFVVFQFLPAAVIE